MNQELAQRLERDAAHLLTLIARVAPAAGLSPREIALIDQLAARSRPPTPPSAVD